MRIGEPEKYTVEDVVFLVSRKWGPRKVQRNTLEALPPAAAGDTEAELARAAAVEKGVLDMLDQVILRIEGLVGEDGEPITEWSRELALELPEPLIAELGNRVIRNASDTRLGNSPETPEATPEASPSTTTEDAL